MRETNGRIFYIFPEPLPLSRARGIQTIKTVAALGKSGRAITLVHEPCGEVDPFNAYGTSRPATVEVWTLSRCILGGAIKSQSIFARRLLVRMNNRSPQDDRSDIIIVRHLKMAFLLLQKAPNLRIIYEAHEVFAEGAIDRKKSHIARMESFVLRNASASVAISNALAQDLREIYRLEQRLAVVPSATDLPDRDTAKDWESCGSAVVYAGSFYSWKGVEDLVVAASLLPPTAKIVLLGGTGHEIEKVRRKVDPRGAQVEFLGHVPHQEVTQVLKRACIAVLPNRDESISRFTSPLKLYEYMAHGCALVASDLPALRESLHNANVSWFEAGDPNKLAQAIRYWISSPSAAEEAGKKNASLARGYTWRDRATKLCEVIDNLPPQQQL
jgi:glycosyltransferase involved in cell wall biosynthesis